MAIQPLKGLATSISFPDGTFDNELEAVAPDTQNAVFYCDAVFPTSPSDGGLFEKGGSGIGTWVGFRDSGAYFRVRAGDGAANISGGGSSTSICAVLDIPAANLPLDNNYHAVVWEVNPSAGTVKLWIDGESYGTGSTSGGGQLEGGSWEGGGSGAWGTSTTTNITGEPTGGWPASVGTLLYAFGVQSVDTNQIDGITQSNYGSDNYGKGYYSAIKFVEASSAVTASASVSAVARRVQNASATVSSTSSVSCSGLRVRQSGTQNPLPTSTATASANYTTNNSAAVVGQAIATTQGVRVQFVSSIVVPASVVVANCERVRLNTAQEIQSFSVLSPVGSIVTAGGSGVVESTSATSASGEIVRLGNGVGAATATTSSAGLIVKNGNAVALPVASVTSDAQRIHQSSSGVSATASLDSFGYVTTSTSATVNAVGEFVEPSGFGFRIKVSGAVTAGDSVIVSIGRYKWEPVVIGSTSWTPIPVSDETWTKLAA